MNSRQSTSQYRHPRRHLVRHFMRRLIRFAFTALSDLWTIGQENLPEFGPLIVVASHFHFADPVAVIRATPWPLDFLGGGQLVDAPGGLAWIPKV
jgi:1-acyl-sn-glycerol-3-phosphate acyltransferase